MDSQFELLQEINVVVECVCHLLRLNFVHFLHGKGMDNSFVLSPENVEGRGDFLRVTWELSF